MAISQIKIGETIHDIEAVKIGIDTIGATTRPVYISKGTPTAISKVAVGYGGTGATTAAGARTNLDVYSKAETEAKYGFALFYCDIPFEDGADECTISESNLTQALGTQRHPQMGDLIIDDDGDLFILTVVNSEEDIEILRLTYTDELQVRASQLESAFNVLDNSIKALYDSNGKNSFDTIEDALNRLSSINAMCAIYFTTIDYCTGDDKVLINWCSGCGDHAIVITNDEIYCAFQKNGSWILERFRNRIWVPGSGANSLIQKGVNATETQTSNTATGLNAVTLGDMNFNSGASALVGGSDNTNEAGYALLTGVGNSNSPGGVNAIIGGRWNANEQKNALIIGQYNEVSATGQSADWAGGSLIAGQTNVVDAYSSTTLGQSNTNKGHNALVNGLLNVLNTGADNSIALGRNNTVATGAYNAIAIGSLNTIKHFQAGAIGRGLESGASSQILVGKFNTASTDAVLVVGAGSSTTNRRNGLEVKTSGDIVTYRHITAGGTITDGNNYNVAETVKQGRSESTEYRPLLLHQAQGAYGADLGTVTGNAHYNEQIAACPSTGEIKAKLFTAQTTDYTTKICANKIESAGHLYLISAQPNSSTGNKSQIVFGAYNDDDVFTEHLAVSSNVNALVINPNTSKTTSQIVLYLNQPSVFPSGIKANLTGNATTATTATKLGSANIGGPNQPIYLMGGVPQACTYSLQLATFKQDGANVSTTPGFVQSGGDVTITDGIITVNDDSHNHTIANVDGLQTELNELDTRITNIVAPTGAGWEVVCEKKSLDVINGWSENSLNFGYAEDNIGYEYMIIAHTSIPTLDIYELASSMIYWPPYLSIADMQVSGPLCGAPVYAKAVSDNQSVITTLYVPSLNAIIDNTGDLKVIFEFSAMQSDEALAATRVFSIYRRKILY